jgi:hypothetical protein
MEVAMSKPTTPEPAPESTGAGELQRRYGSRWTIELNETLHMWTALQTNGRSSRYLVAPTATQLLAKLDAAETAAP